MKKILLTLLVGGVFAQYACAEQYYEQFKQLPQKQTKHHAKQIKSKTKVKPWRNDLRSLFLRGGASIVAVNMRTFFAIDENKNEIIEPELGERSGTFITGLLGIEELARTGVNTIHLLPITPVGKMKALGTAGSLYAMSDFSSINPQLIDEKSVLSAEEQAKLFIEECHKKNIRVILDLPSCGSYDMYLENPNLFEKDASGQPIIPADWTDVRLFKVKNANGQLNQELYDLHVDFVNMALRIGVDGIRADVATIKPYEFWQKLISYTRQKDPQFLFLAEASDSWTTPPSKYAVFTPYDKLLEAGFDGYYGSYFKFRELKSASEFADIVNFNMQLTNKYPDKKAVIGSFMTHDETNPMVDGGITYVQQLIWLNSVLPVNTYIVDGLTTGDNYFYSYANRSADDSMTDDFTYFVHKGKFDIFNFSRTPGGNHYELLHDYHKAQVFKKNALNFINSADFKTLKTNNQNVFAYSRSDGKDSLVIILNKNLHSPENAKVKIRKMNKETSVVPIKFLTAPERTKGAFVSSLLPAEIQILYLPGFAL